MLKKLLIPTVGIVALAILSGVGLAGVPCTGTSTVSYTETSPPCTAGLPMCPKGDRDTLKIAVTVQDCYGTALVGKNVTIRCLAAPGTFFFKVTSDSNVTLVTDGSGQVSYKWANVGGCGNISWSVVCAGVELGPTAAYYIADFDLNSPPSGKCDAVDFGIFGGYGHYGSTTYPCGDFNCSGKEDAVDFAMFGVHYGHF